MDRKTARELLDNGLLEAYANGEEIEYNSIFGGWKTCKSNEQLGFNLESSNYFIKRKEPTVDDIGKIIEVSNYIDGEYVERCFLSKFEGMFYCINSYNNTVANAWKYARVKSGQSKPS